MRRWGWILALALAACDEPDAPGPVGPAPRQTATVLPGPPVEESPAVLPQLTVASWNLLNLRGDERPGRTAEALAGYIGESGAVIVALQEIHDTDPDAEIANYLLNDTCARLSGAGAGDPPPYRWKPSLFNLVPRPSFGQFTGVVYNSDRVRLLVDERSPLPLDFPRASIHCPDHGSDHIVWDRRPAVAHFSAGEGLTDFALVIVHMKAMDDAEHRLHEAEVLVAHLEAILQYEPDTIILGDFNSLEGEPALGRLQQAGFDDLGSVPSHRVGPIDRALVARECTEVIRGTLGVGRDSSTLSDHRMIHFLVQVRADDD